MHRRAFLLAGSSVLGAMGFARGGRAFAPVPPDRPRPRPTPAQLRWQQDELALFFHFGVNTFTDREWGDGTESPAIFNPSSLDARQWTRAARAAGAKAAILTAKHHDGFCLWPTRTTRHSVAASPWRAGDGDLVREFVDACRADGLRPGLYLSPWDRNHPAYGDSPRYNDVYVAQLTELLTGYGELAEVWFDGANGEGPGGRRQIYDWPKFWGVVRRLQPGAVMFSDAGPDVRWCGNENGSAGEPNWSMVNPDVVTAPGVSGPGVTEALQHGDPSGTVWRPAEADTSIRPGWFHHSAEDGRVRSADRLVDLYFRSVGRNSKLLLNVPPTRAGQLHDTDVARLLEMRRRLTALFAEDLAAGRPVRWTRTDPRTAVAEVDLGRTTPVGVVRLAEPIAEGQAVARFRVQRSETAAPTGRAAGDAAAGGDVWQDVAAGATIGYARLERFAPVPVRRLRVVVDDAVVPPSALTVQVF
ncbi:MAG: alpha-L-fucosidase [Vicinamibacterales bacterium]